MVEREKSLFENLIAGPSGWTDAYHQLQQLIGARGAVLFLLLATALVVWWKWEEIVKRPWIKSTIERFKLLSIRPVPPGRLTIAVAHLQDDEGQTQEKLLLNGLRDFEGVVTLAVDRMVEWPASGTEQEKKKETEGKARGLLKQTGADVLIWGSVLSLHGKSAMRLYWTPSQDVPEAIASGNYQPQTETIALPEAFWSDVKQIFGLLARSRLAELIFDRSGHYIAERVAPLIAQVRALIESKEGVWNPKTLAGVRFSLADALAIDGDLSGKNESLAESIALYRQVLKENTRESVPLERAKTQVCLGNALQTLGALESGTARLKEAVAAYRAALQELTQARVPLDWAMTQMNLGNALLGLGGRESGTARLTEAVAACREALKEYTLERVPLQWASTQMNLGIALWRLGGRESGTARLTEAVAACREALKEFKPKRVPIAWARTQMNLGNALASLGERESGTARLDDAVAAYTEALTEFTRESMPLYWAGATGNQGVTLVLLAERRGDAEMAKLAVQQIEAAFAKSRDGGDAPSAAYFEAQLPKARALAGELAKR